MAWTGLTLTVDGRNALNQSQLSNRMNIKSIAVGDGNAPGNFSILKGLVHQLYEITNLKIDVVDGKCTLTADFPKVDYDYYFREVGVVVATDTGDKLYVYDNCGDDAQHMVYTTGVESTQKRIRLSLYIDDVAQITVSNPSILYVGYDDYEKTVGRLEEAIDAAKEQAAEDLDGHVQDTNNPHKITAKQLGLDPTSDMDKPVSIAQQAALDALYQQMTAYTQQKIADLINGAPTSLDTLKEVADAIAAHKTIMDALDAAIGKKANAAEFDSHTKDATKHITAAERTKWNAKMETTGDSANNTTTFTSGDATNPTGWADIGLVASGEKHNSLMRKFSLAIKNVRYLWKLLGSTSLSGIGDGTVTGAINALNTGLAGKAASIHDHDSRYYTEDEIDSRLIKQNYFKSSDIVWLGITIVTLRYGKSVTLHTFSGTLSADLTAYQKYTIGQMQPEYRPAYQITKIINIQGDVTAMLNILPGGAVELTPYAVLHRGYVPLIFETYMLK